MKSPMIGVTADVSSDGHLYLRHQYVESIVRAGGAPVIIATQGGERAAVDALGFLDGVLLTGGADIDPARYGRKREPETARIVCERDAVEIAFAREAIRRSLPLLAICRGGQLVNVIYGGTLCQDIEKHLGIAACVHNQKEDYAVCTDTVSVADGSLLQTIVGKKSIDVNSRHHQCIEKLGVGLRLNAVSSHGGIVEGFEDPALAFLLAVQWHPEMLAAEHSEAQALFNGLIAAARAK